MLHTLKVSLLALLLTATAAAGVAQAAPAQPSDPVAFMNEVGRKASDFRTLKTDFVQEKKMAMFRDKLVIKGHIALQKPDKIAWHVDSPLRYSVFISDRKIRQWDEDSNKVQEISLANNPIFQNILGQMRVWFSGEYGSLLEGHTVRLVQSAPLVLEFIPKENNMARKVMKSIVITFRNDQKYLQQIRINEVNGDVTTIHFTNTILNPPVDGSSFEVKGRV